MKGAIHQPYYVEKVKATAEAIFISMMTTSDRNLNDYEISQLGIKATKHAMAFHKSFGEVMCGRA